MNLKRINYFSKILLGIILTFCLQTNIFATNPNWELSKNLKGVFDYLPEEIKLDLNKISISFTQGDFNASFNSLGIFLNSHPNYERSIIILTGYAGIDEHGNFVISPSTLKNFTRSCKSAINNNFRKLGYLTIERKYVPKILKKLFKNNEGEIRKWVVKENIIRITKTVPDVSDVINLNDFFGLD